MLHKKEKIDVSMGECNDNTNNLTVPDTTNHWLLTVTRSAVLSSIVWDNSTNALTSTNHEMVAKLTRTLSE